MSVVDRTIYSASVLRIPILNENTVEHACALGS